MARTYQGHSKELQYLRMQDIQAYEERLLRLDISSIEPGAGDLQFYQEHGYWVSRKRILSDEEIEAIEYAVARHHMGHRDRRLPIDLPAYLDWNPGIGDKFLRISDYIAHMNDVVRRNLLIPEIGFLAARLAGVQQIRLHNSSFVQKLPESPQNEFKVGWHTDKAYWPTSSSNRMLTAWIPLHDATEENGTLTVLDGSHKWEARPDVTALQRERGFTSKDHDGLESQLRELGLHYMPVAVVVPKGHISFHHCLLFHGSGRNRSPLPRKAAVLHLQDGDNHYREIILPDGAIAHYKNDDLVQRDKRGLPDYSDPIFCPVLWDEDRIK